MRSGSSVNGSDCLGLSFIDVTQTAALPGPVEGGQRWGPKPWKQDLASAAPGPPLLARPAPPWALALEGLQRRGDSVARRQLLGNALFLLAWPPLRGPRPLGSSSCLLQPLARPQSHCGGQVRGGQLPVGLQES